MSEWIPVEECQPITDKLLEVKIKYDDGIYDSRYWNGKFYDDEYCDWFSDVTHYRYVAE